MKKPDRPRAKDSIRSHRIKKQGGQSGGPGYPEKIDGKSHDKNPAR